MADQSPRPPGTLSPDGLYQWDGSSWQPVVSAPPTAPLALTDASAVPQPDPAKKQSHRVRNLGVGIGIGVVALIVLIFTIGPSLPLIGPSLPGGMAEQSFDGGGDQQITTHLKQGDYQVIWQAKGTCRISFALTNADNGRTYIATELTTVTGENAGYADTGIFSTYPPVPEGRYYLHIFDIFADPLSGTGSLCSWHVRIRAKP
jgi:hypothetical protein